MFTERFRGFSNALSFGAYHHWRIFKGKIGDPGFSKTHTMELPAQQTTKSWDIVEFLFYFISNATITWHNHSLRSPNPKSKENMINLKYDPRQ